LEEGDSYANTKKLSISIEESVEGTRLRAQNKDLSFDVFANLPEGHERLAVVVPWSKKRFQYTVKDVARPASGKLIIAGKEIEVSAGASWAVLDHGRGRWPYNINWNWGAGSGVSGGKTIGIQVGAKWTAGTGVSENAFFIDGKMHKIHGETKWDYDLQNWQSPWKIVGGGLDAVFEPFYNKQSRMNFGVLAGRTDQCFGHWSGSFTTQNGQKVMFSGVSGFAEEVHNRW
ncbi:MAG TPA: DUF2804 domain-containing protein, partial [Microbacteriaceae bacterium]|nr:DUF2804 domain-containing protein [Microbacteriaceae bacterium]